MRAFIGRSCPVLVPALTLVGCSFLADRGDFRFDAVDAGGPDVRVDAAPLDALPMGECVEDDDCETRPNARVACERGRCISAGCVTGFDDCDGVAANGCETSISDDVRHCGSCGMVCSYPQAQALCQAGACVLGPCREGFDNCDGVAATGCDSDLRSAGSCGACGARCVAPQPLCDSSSGEARCVERCTGDGVLCGTQCVDVRADVRHCGGCDAPCGGGPQASPVCTGTPPACGLVCDEGYGDCTAGPGCETDLRTSILHCGACGSACEGRNASWSCAARSCRVLACATGFDDCDGSPANGCEADLTTNTAHCGACGNACSVGERCVGGVCDPVVGGGGDENHLCVVRDGGRAYCAGDNEFRQIAGEATPWRGQTMTLVTRSDGSPFLARDVVASAQSTCAIGRVGVEEGRIHCWGRGETASPGGGLTVWPTALAGPEDFAARRFVRLSGHTGRVCALDAEGAIWCWGQNRTGGDSGAAFPLGTGSVAANPVARLDAPVAARQLTLGRSNLCFIGVDDLLYCRGQRLGNGNGDAANRDVFAAVEGLTEVVAADAQDAAVCALRRNGELLCWGFNGYGQVGNGTTSDVSTPVRVLDQVAHVGLSERATCAIRRSNGQVWCWGEQRNGLAASGSLADGHVLTPQRVDDLPGNALLRGAHGFLRGVRHGCVLRAGAPSCWGSSDAMAPSTSAASVIPATALALPAGVRVLDGGLGGAGPNGNGCVRTDDGAVRCFGTLRFGLAGPGDLMLRYAEGTPLVHPGLTSGIEGLAVGVNFACATSSSGASCWGLNGAGRLGQIAPTSTGSPIPVALPAGHGARSPAAALQHACVVLTSGGQAGSTWCWGSNADGRLGRDPAMTGATAGPGAVEGLPGAADEVALTNTATFITVEGRLYRVGALTGASATFAPTEMTRAGGAELTGISRLSGGRDHACGIVASSPSAPGVPHCWGSGSSGQLGGGPSGPTVSPVMGVTNAVHVAAGHEHVCAALADGAVVCWGRDDNGERRGLVAAGAPSSMPSVVPGLAGIERVYAGTFGARRTIAVAADGTAFCWGENLAGSCGVGEPMRVPNARPMLGIPGLSP